MSTTRLIQFLFLKQNTWMIITPHMLCVCLQGILVTNPFPFLGYKDLHISYVAKGALTNSFCTEEKIYKN